MYMKDLREDAPAKNIQDMISTIALSLISSGKTQFSTKGLATEIKKRTGIDIPYGTMMDILSTLPFVDDINAETITLGTGGTSSGDAAPEENSEELVSDMATKAAVSLNREK